VWPGSPLALHGEPHTQAGSLLQLAGFALSGKIASTTGAVSRRVRADEPAAVITTLNKVMRFGGGNWLDICHVLHCQNVRLPEMAPLHVLVLVGMGWYVGQFCQRRTSSNACPGLFNNP
jgi:hypothetical protein